MPRLSQLLADPNLMPTQTGMPRGAIDVRLPQLPGIPAGAGQEDIAGLAQMAEGVGAIGEGLRQQAVFASRQAAMQAKKKQGLDTLDAERLSQEAIQQRDAFEAESRRNPDTRGHPQRLREFALQLKDTYATRLERLDPVAQGKFLREFEQYNSLLFRGAEEFAFKADMTQRDATVENAKQMAKQGILGNTDPAMRQFHSLRYLKSLQELVDVGLLPAAKMSSEYRTTVDEIETEEANLAIQTIPDKMLPHLLALAEGKAGNPDLPVPPLAAIPKMVTEARKLRREAASDMDRQERRIEAQRTQAQQAALVELRTELTNVVPLQQNLGQYDALKRKIDLAASGGPSARISENGHQELLTLHRTLSEAAKNPPQVDDPAVERAMTLRVHTAENPADFTVARNDVLGNAGKLKPETLRTMLTTLESREDRNHWTRLPGVVQGRRELLGGEVNEAVMVAMLRGPKQEEEQTRLRNALIAYNTRMEELARQDPKLADAQGPAIGRELHQTLVANPKRLKSVKLLPQPLQGPDGLGIQEESAVVQVIAQHRHLLSEAEQGRWLQQWREWKRVNYPVQTPAGTAAPAPPRGNAPGTTSREGRSN